MFGVLMFHCLLTIGNVRFRNQYWTHVQHLLLDHMALRTSQPCETSGGGVASTGIVRLCIDPLLAGPADARSAPDHRR
jgi:hypothetical protein